MPTNTLPRDPALQDPTRRPAGAPPASPESPAAPVPPAQSSRRQPAPNRPQSAESAVPPTPSPAAPAAASQASRAAAQPQTFHGYPPNLQVSEEGRSAPLLYTDANGRVTSVAPSREAEFLEDCRRAGLAVKRATRFRDDRGRTVTVALDRRDEFLADAQHAGLQVTELTPAAPESQGRGAAPHPQSQASKPPSLQTSEGGGNAAAPANLQGVAADLYDIRDDAALEDFAHGLYDDGALRANTFAEYMKRQGVDVFADGNRVSFFNGRERQTIDFLPDGRVASSDPALQSRLQADTFMRGRGAPANLSLHLQPVLGQALAFNDAVRQANIPRLRREFLEFQNSLGPLSAEEANREVMSDYVPSPEPYDPSLLGRIGRAVTDTGKVIWNAGVSVGEGVVATAALGAIAGGKVSRWLGVADEHSARLSDPLLDGLNWIHENVRADLSWQDDPEHKDPYGVKQGVAGAGEIVFSFGTAGALEKLAGKGSVKLAGKAAKESAPLADKIANPVEARALERAIARTPAPAANATAQEVRQYSANLAKEYGRALVVEQAKNGFNQAAVAALKPNAWSVIMAALNGSETYQAVMANGGSVDKAALEALGDAGTTYLLMNLINASGAFLMGTSTTQTTQAIAAFKRGSRHANLWQSIAGSAMRINVGGGAMGASTWQHLERLQQAGVPITEEDQLGAAAVSGVFGAVTGALSSIIPIRNAIIRDKQRALYEQGYGPLRGADPRLNPNGTPPTGPTSPTGPAGRPEGAPSNQPISPGAQSAILPRPSANQPAGQSPAAPHWAQIAAATNTGDVLFRDGSLYRARTGDFLMPNGAIVDAQGNILSVAGPAAQTPATPTQAPTGEAAPASTRPKVGDVIETPENQQAIRDALVPQPAPQNAAPLPDDTTPQQAFLAFENTLAGKRFITPLGDAVSFNEGHFGRVTCAGTPEGKDNPSKRKGFIAGYPSAQAARQALREGKVNADQIQGYQPGRAALIPLIPDLLQRPQYIIEKEGAQHFVKQYELGNGRTLLAVLRKFGDDLRIISFHPMQIRGSQLKNGRILFAEDTANLQWSAGTSETGMPPSEDTSIPQTNPAVNPARPTGEAAPSQTPTSVAPNGAPANQPVQAQSAKPSTAISQSARAAAEPQTFHGHQPVSGQRPDTALAVLNLYELLRRADAKVHNVPLGALRVNFRIPQFKGDADPVTGEVAGHELQGEYQRIPAKPIVVIQWRDGTMEVATGRHRLGLARRNGLETIPANIIKESEGWTPEAAGLLDAIDNVLDEKGAIQDYLKLFRFAGIDRATAQAKGLLARTLGRQAFDIAEGASDDLYAIVMGKDRWVTADVAAAICREAPRSLGSYAESVQRAVARQVMDRRMGADDAAILARDLMHRRAQSDQARTVMQDDLFGADDTALLIMAEQAAYAADKRRAATKDLQRINAALQKGDALSLKGDFAKRHGITDPKSAAQLQAAADRLRQTIAAWEHYYLDPALSAEANAKAREILGLEALPVLTESGNVQTAAEAGVDIRPQTPAAEPQDDLTDSLFSPTAPDDGASLGSPTTPGGEAAQPAAVKQSKREAREAQRARMVTTHDLGLGGLTDEESNGPDFTPLAEGENFDSIRTAVDTMRKGETSVSDVFGIRYKVKSGRDAGKTANYTKEGEDARAHQYAAKNVIQLAKRAGVAVRQDNYKPNSPNKTYVRLFAPYFFENRLYIAVIAQYEADVNGVHAVEALDVIRADVNPEVISRDPLAGLAPTGTQSALDTISIPQKGLTVNELSLESIQRVIDNPKKGGNQHPRLLDPDGNGGLTETLCTAQDVAGRILTDIDAFVRRAKTIAKHRLQPGQELGTYTLANAPIHVALQEGRAIVTGLANIPQSQVADVLTALDAQLGPTLPILTSDNPAPLVQNLIQARNSRAEAHTLANPAPESQASNPPSLQTSAAGGSAASRAIVPPERIVNGVRVLTTSVYPMRGQVVGRLGPLGGADGAPARAFGRKPLTTFDLALLYRDLTGGELPTVVHNRAQMGKALGRYYVGQNKIRIAAQIFGLIDESDIRALHDTLAKRGFFLHERPEWAATKTKKQLQAQKEVSEKALERELQKLLKRRIRSGAEPGLPAPKVLAHELWHLIDDQDGGLVGRGNLVGHLAALKRYTADAFPVAGFAGNTELKAEAKAFITWWRGIGRDEPYFDQPEEMYAEIGAAYFCAPSVLQERAPNCFAAWDHAIQNHPRAAKAYADAVAYIANGSRPDLIHKTLGETWGREHDQALRRLNQAVQGFDNSLTAWRRRIIAALWDDRGPALDLVRKAYKERLAEIQEVRRKGGASDLALKLQERRLKALLDKVRLSHVLYRRKGPNNARLYLADVKGEFLERLTDIDPNPDIARYQVELYATYHRIIELGGRAAAYGVDPVQARGQLADLHKTLGQDTFRKVVRAWNVFRALYERDVIERPATTELLGKDFVELMRKNTHYVTTKHTVTPERLQALLDGLEHGKGGALELAAEQLIKRSGEDTDVGNFLKEYKGSLDPTKNPLLETIKTAVSIITLAERNQTVLDWVRALRALRSDEVQERPYAQRVRNDRVGYVEFYENGERKVLIVPRSVAAGFERVDSTWLTAITHTTRVINAALTTNNYGFVPFAQMRDLSSAVYNTPGLHRWTAHWLFPALGDLAALGAQFVPPAALRALAEHPLGKLLINKNTIEYWSSYGNRAARLIHSGDFQGELERARQDRLAGNEASARDREFIVQMARQALRDGILLSMVQLRKQDYNESEWRTLFARYNLDFDDIPANESLLLKGAKLPARAIAAYWNGAGALSELASATVKLAAYCYLHQDALRPGAITPDNRPAPSLSSHAASRLYQDATPDSPSFTALQDIANAFRAAVLAGDPTFDIRGYLMTYFEWLTGPFLNARIKGAFRIFQSIADDAPRSRRLDGKRPSSTKLGHTAEYAAKLAAKLTSRKLFWFVTSGAAATAVLELYRYLTDNPQATPQDMDGTPLGNLHGTLDWIARANKNISPYFLQNYNNCPLATFGDVTLHIAVPIADEEKIPIRLFDALINATSPDWSPNPATGPADVAAEVFSTVANSPESRGTVIGLAAPLTPWIFQSNPYDPFRQTNLLTDEEFAARWTNPAAIQTASGRLIDSTPLALILKSTPNTTPERQASLNQSGWLGDFHDTITRTPIISNVAGRFLRVSVGGETDRRRKRQQLDQQQVLAVRLLAKQNAAKYTAGQPLQEPDIDPVYMPDYIKAFLNALQDQPSPATLPLARLQELRSTLRIRDPRLREQNLRSLQSTP